MPNPETLFKTAAALFAFLAAGTALSGANSWRRQFRAKADFERARSTLSSIFRLRESIKEFRSSSRMYYLLLLGVTQEEMADPEVEKMWEEWEAVKTARSKVHEFQLDAEVTWGKPFLKNFGPLDKLSSSRNFPTVPLSLRRT